VCGPSGEVLTAVDLTWPNGVQEGYSRPVALVLPEDQEQNQVPNQVFTVTLTVKKVCGSTWKRCLMLECKRKAFDDRREGFANFNHRRANRC